MNKGKTLVSFTTRFRTRGTSRCRKGELLSRELNRPNALREFRRIDDESAGAGHEVGIQQQRHFLVPFRLFQQQHDFLPIDRFHFPLAGDRLLQWTHAQILRHGTIGINSTSNMAHACDLFQQDFTCHRFQRVGRLGFFLIHGGLIKGELSLPLTGQFVFHRGAAADDGG